VWVVVTTGAWSILSSVLWYTYIELYGTNNNPASVTFTHRLLIMDMTLR